MVDPNTDNAASSLDAWEERITRALPVLGPVVVVVAAFAAAYVVDIGASLLVLAGGVLLAVIGTLWASVRTLVGEAPTSLDVALALAAPTAAEEQKRAVLQALKDLEHERSLGKLDDADYTELKTRYRSQAKRLLQELDRDLEPRRAVAEAWVARALAGGSASAAARRAPRASGDGGKRPACGGCGTHNEPDARFCKGCGAKMGGPRADA